MFCQRTINPLGLQIQLNWRLRSLHLRKDQNREEAGMRAVVQRVSRAKVTVEGAVVGEIGRGLLVLLGVAPEDTQEHVRWMADKVVGLRIFRDDEGKMNRDVVEVGGSVLVVSQFTLYGDCQKGRRPSFIGAARPEHAIPDRKSVV